MARGHLVFAQSNEALCRLLQAVASGDRKAFRTLYDKCRTGPFWNMRTPHAGSRPGRGRSPRSDDTNLAEGASFRRFQGQCHGWMAVVTSNFALSRIAATPPPSSVARRGRNSGGGRIPVRRRSGHRADVRQCLKKLNEKYRKCVTLIYLHGISYEELATQMDAPRKS